MDIGPSKYKQGDYVRIRFASGHCKAMINKVKRNKRVDAAMRDGSMSKHSPNGGYMSQYNPNGWFYQVAKHYSTGNKAYLDLTKAYWSSNLKLEICEGEIIGIEPMPVKAKLEYLSTGMTVDTFNILIDKHNETLI